MTVLEFLVALGSNLDKPLRPHARGWAEPSSSSPSGKFAFVGYSSTTLTSNPSPKARSPTARSGGSGSRTPRARRAMAMNSPTWPTCAKSLFELRRLRQGRSALVPPLKIAQQQALEFEVRFPFGPRRPLRRLGDRLGRNRQDGAIDRRFFARTGESLYLMLTRAKRGAELGDTLAKRLFHRRGAMNRLARALQGEPRPEDPRQSVSRSLKRASTEVCEDCCRSFETCRSTTPWRPDRHLRLEHAALLPSSAPSGSRAMIRSSPDRREIVSKSARVRALCGDSFSLIRACPPRRCAPMSSRFWQDAAWAKAASNTSPTSA